MNNDQPRQVKIRNGFLIPHATAVDASFHDVPSPRLRALSFSTEEGITQRLKRGDPVRVTDVEGWGQSFQGIVSDIYEDLIVLNPSSEGELCEGQQYDVELSFSTVTYERMETALRNLQGSLEIGVWLQMIIESYYAPSLERVDSVMIENEIISAGAAITDLHEQSGFEKVQLDLSDDKGGGASIDDELQTMMEEDDLKLNESQQLAITNSMRSFVALIHGPPGTGKTHTTAALSKHWLRPVLRSGNAKVLVVAQSNKAVVSSPRR
jgi:hypothetical protein